MHASQATLLLKYLALGLIIPGVLLVTYILGTQPPLDAPRMGRRGLKRVRAIERGGLFAWVEPAIRYVASFVSQYELKGVRPNLKRELLYAGEHNGLSPDEFVGQQVLTGLFGIVFVLSVSKWIPLSFYTTLPAIGFAIMAPRFSLNGVIKQRQKEVNRGLPGTIDLAALCMGAGMDFVGALRNIVAYKPAKPDPIYEEFELILQQLELGHTRRQALSDFAERCPTEAVKDFVGAVTQSEEKGNPLAEVLAIQATVLRMRRSVAAEEAAARAGVMMMGPLMMIFAAIMIIILGPFVIDNMQHGL